MYEKRLLYLLAGLSVSVAVHGSTVVGENYRLNCSVAGADSFSPTNITYQWFNESSIPPMQVGTQQTFTFNPLQLYHAGNYTCIVSVSGLTGNFSQSAAQIITVESKHADMRSYQFLFTMYISDTPARKVYVIRRKCDLHNGISPCFYVFLRDGV